jgi:hypothetical protein
MTDGYRGGPTARPSRSPDLNPLWGHLQLLCMQLVLTTEKHFTIALWMSVNIIRNFPGIFERGDGPLWDASWRAPNLTEVILSTYYKCTLSAITHKLNVSGHMLMCIFFLVLVCGTRVQSLSALFSYTLWVWARVCRDDQFREFSWIFGQLHVFHVLTKMSKLVRSAVFHSRSASSYCCAAIKCWVRTQAL